MSWLFVVPALISVLGRQRQLVYKVSSRGARDTERNPVLEKTKNKKENLRKKENDYILFSF